MKKSLSLFLLAVSIVLIDTAYSLPVQQLAFSNGNCMFACGNSEQDITTSSCPKNYELSGGWCSGASADGVSCINTAHISCGSQGVADADFTVSGTVASWDFHGGFVNHFGDDSSSYGGEYVNGFCKFECTGTGYHCPTEPLFFDQLSGGNEPLKCENLNYSANAGACQILAVQTCSHTTVIDVADQISDSDKGGGSGPQFISSPSRPNINGPMWWVSDFSGGLNSDNPSHNDPTANIFVIQSFTDSNGKSLDATQTFFEMGANQLIEKNSKAPVKK